MSLPTLKTVRLRDISSDGGAVEYALADTEARSQLSTLSDTVDSLGRSLHSSAPTIPQDYGAVADGVTDDYKAIQAAIDSLGTSGGCVYLPAGSYAISQALSITNPGVWLRGESIYSTRLRITGSTLVIQAVDSPYIKITDMTITGNGIYDRGGGISVARKAHTEVGSITLKSLRIADTGTYDGVYIGYGSDVVISGVVVSSAYGSGISVASSSNVSISGSYALSCNNAGFLLSSDNGASISGCRATSCGDGFKVSGSSAISIDGCYSSLMVSRGDDYPQTDYHILNSYAVGVHSCQAVQASSLSPLQSIALHNEGCTGLVVSGLYTTGAYKYGALDSVIQDGLTTDTSSGTSTTRRGVTVNANAEYHQVQTSAPCLIPDSSTGTFTQQYE